MIPSDNSFMKTIDFSIESSSFFEMKENQDNFEAIECSSVGIFFIDWALFPENTIVFTSTLSCKLVNSLDNSCNSVFN